MPGFPVKASFTQSASVKIAVGTDASSACDIPHSEPVSPLETGHIPLVCASGPRRFDPSFPEVS